MGENKNKLPPKPQKLSKKQQALQNSALQEAKELLGLANNIINEKDIVGLIDSDSEFIRNTAKILARELLTVTPVSLQHAKNKFLYLITNSDNSGKSGIIREVFTRLKEYPAFEKQFMLSPARFEEISKAYPDEIYRFEKPHTSDSLAESYITNQVQDIAIATDKWMSSEKKYAELQNYIQNIPIDYLNMVYDNLQPEYKQTFAEHLDPERVNLFLKNCSTYPKQKEFFDKLTSVQTDKIHADLLVAIHPDKTRTDSGDNLANKMIPNESPLPPPLPPRNRPEPYPEFLYPESEVNYTELEWKNPEYPRKLQSPAKAQQIQTTQGSLDGGERKEPEAAKNSSSETLVTSQPQQASHIYGDTPEEEPIYEEIPEKPKKNPLYSMLNDIRRRIKQYINPTKSPMSLRSIKLPSKQPGEEEGRY